MSLLHVVLSFNLLNGHLYSLCSSIIAVLMREESFCANFTFSEVSFAPTIFSKDVNCARIRKKRKDQFREVIIRINMDISIKNLESNRGKPVIIIIDGHKYRQAFVKKSGEIRWRCTTKECPATVYTHEQCITMLSGSLEHPYP